MKRFETITALEPPTSYVWFHALLPGTILDRNGVRYRIVSVNRFLRKLILRRLG